MQTKGRRGRDRRRKRKGDTKMQRWNDHAAKERNREHSKLPFCSMLEPECQHWDCKCDCVSRFYEFPNVTLAVERRSSRFTLFSAFAEALMARVIRFNGSANKLCWPVDGLSP
ncbi:hypothetical protein J3458_007014 [Metarhizium acridum]|uniref:uncharacterized protein n=1 Tax=Metarhizium acridum TaxID=92637 RepID=UPI001C6B51B1|nr:hypothetical protein J3458_007014 [Metarhizium acridum]